MGSKHCVFGCNLPEKGTAFEKNGYTVTVTKIKISGIFITIISFVLSTPSIVEMMPSSGEILQRGGF